MAQPQETPQPTPQPTPDDDSPWLEPFPGAEAVPSSAPSPARERMILSLEDIANYQPDAATEHEGGDV